MFIGCALLALAPAISMFYYAIGENAVLIIIFIFSAFIWQISFTIASVLFHFSGLEVPETIRDTVNKVSIAPLFTFLGRCRSGCSSS